ncbi:tetratricopeptide repeat protein [Phragmitibacter flavus]|uniref:Tetratricopeptide repeat protein n=1 Tax=Phragmitibacter flavus TaxID=2576071 RepID=A0A5R8K8W4_9BACT|nr:tetratricopeptide repeat protein [Phragmitibacter flavus]TLD68774.1 tetratricopeptide repeat protein [Phragmitibacter flavus]
MKTVLLLCIAFAFLPTLLPAQSIPGVLMEMDIIESKMSTGDKGHLGRIRVDSVDSSDILQVTWNYEAGGENKGYALMLDGRLAIFTGPALETLSIYKRDKKGNHFIGRRAEFFANPPKVKKLKLTPEPFVPEYKSSELMRFVLDINLETGFGEAIELLGNERVGRLIEDEDYLVSATIKPRSSGVLLLLTPSPDGKSARVQWHMLHSPVSGSYVCNITSLPGGVDSLFAVRLSSSAGIFIPDDVATEKTVQTPESDMIQADLIFEQSLKLVQEGKAEDAIKGFTRALKVYPDHIKSLGARGGMKVDMGDHSGAIADFEKLLPGKHLNASLWRARGMAYERAGCPRFAIHCYHRAISQDPNFGRAFASLGLIHVNLGQPAKAIEYIDRYIELTPKGIDIYQYRAVSLAQLGRHKEALADFDHYLKSNPDNLHFRFKRGTTLIDLQQWNQAIEAFQGIIAANPADAAFHAEVWHHIAYVQRQLKQWELSIAASTQAAALNPQDPVFVRERGITHFISGNSEAALADVELALKLNPSDKMALSYRGKIRLVLGEWKNAATDLEQALENGIPKGGIPHAPLHLWLCRLQLRADRAAADDELIRHYRTGGAPLSPWFITLIDYITGHASEDRVDASIVDATDDYPTAVVWFYVGMVKVQAQDAAGAKADFAKSVATGRTDLAEVKIANMILQKR